MILLLEVRTIDLNGNDYCVYLKLQGIKLAIGGCFMQNYRDVWLKTMSFKCFFRCHSSGVGSVLCQHESPCAG